MRSPDMARHRCPICCSLGAHEQFVERNIWLLSCLPSRTYSRFTVQRHPFVMRCVFSYSGAPSFARLGHNRSHRTRPQPQTAHRYHGSLTHLRDPARLARIAGNVLELLKEPQPHEDSAALELPQWSGELTPEFREQFQRSLRTHLFGRSNLLSQRLRIALASYYQVYSHSH